MATINVKVPDSQKEHIEQLAEELNYPSTSEYVRTALREKEESDMELSEEAVEKIKEARERDETISHKEAKEELLG